MTTWKQLYFKASYVKEVEKYFSTHLKWLPNIKKKRDSFIKNII